MKLKHGSFLGIAILACMTLSIQSAGQDSPQWRGPNRDGGVASFTESQTWPERLTQRWKVEVGLGYATPLLVGDRIYLFSRQGDNEVMTAFDAATGRRIWQTGYPVTFEMHSAAVRHERGPKSTPLFAEGRLYSLGMTGVVTAFDAATGRQLWQKPGSDIVPMYTSHSFSPIFDRGLVIFHLGGHNEGALTAFDAVTGDVRWRWTGDGPGYGSPIVAELGGARQIITITQGKVIGVDVATGALLWERPYVSPNFTNGITPVLHQQLIIVSGNGGPTTAFTVSRQNNQWATQTVWENADIPYRLSNAVVIGEWHFGLTNRNAGQYFSVDAKTGKTLWLSEPRQAGNAAVLKSGNLAFSLEDDGELVVFRSGPSAFQELRRYKVADTETWTQPVISTNRFFVKDVTTLALWTAN
jgi:outer membrane protein assembly factor BamB